MDKKELNYTLCQSLGFKIAQVTPVSGDGLIIYPHNNKVNFDPCNNWNHLMPIAIGNRVFLNPTAEDRCNHKYVAKAQALVDSEAGKVHAWTSKFNQYGDDPMVTVVKCLIAKLESEDA